MELNFREGLQRGQTIGKAAQVLAGLVAVSSGLCAIGVTLFINGNWPDALIGTYDFHGLDMLLLADFLILVASFFVVGAWIWRAHKNIELTDAFVTEFSPGWAINSLGRRNAVLTQAMPLLFAPRSVTSPSSL